MRKTNSFFVVAASCRCDSAFQIDSIFNLDCLFKRIIRWMLNDGLAEKFCVANVNARHTTAHKIRWVKNNCLVEFGKWFFRYAMVVLVASCSVPHKFYHLCHWLHQSCEIRPDVEVKEISYIFLLTLPKILKTKQEHAKWV